MTFQTRSTYVDSIATRIIRTQYYATENGSCAFGSGIVVGDRRGVTDTGVGRWVTVETRTKKNCCNDARNRIFHAFKDPSVILKYI